jgi:hypothetical protein
VISCLANSKSGTEHNEQPGTFQVARLSKINKKFNTRASNFLTECRLSYPEEAPLVQIAPLKSLNFQHTFNNSALNFSALSNKQTFTVEISCVNNSDHESLKILHHFFEQIKLFYCYAKKVTFPDSHCPVNLVEDKLLITHLDILVLGIIRIVQGRHSGTKARLSQVGSLMKFLKEAQTLAPESWQWEKTQPRLQSLIARYETAITEKEKDETAKSLVSPTHSTSRPSSLIASEANSGRNSVDLSNGDNKPALVPKKGSNSATLRSALAFKQSAIESPPRPRLARSNTEGKLPISKPDSTTSRSSPILK